MMSFRISGSFRTWKWSKLLKCCLSMFILGKPEKPWRNPGKTHGNPPSSGDDRAPGTRPRIQPAEGEGWMVVATAKMVDVHGFFP